MSDETTGTAENTEHGHDEHHAHGGTMKYWYVFGALAILTAMSFWIGNSSFKDEVPRVAWAAMMAVSCCKALCVMLAFMHLWWEANWKYVLTIPATLMSVFLVLMLVPDVGLRNRNYAPERELHAAEPDPTRYDREKDAEESHAHDGEDNGH